MSILNRPLTSTCSMKQRPRLILQCNSGPFNKLNSRNGENAYHNIVPRAGQCNRVHPQQNVSSDWMKRLRHKDELALPVDKLQPAVQEKIIPVHMVPSIIQVIATIQ